MAVVNPQIKDMIMNPKEAVVHLYKFNSKADPPTPPHLSSQIKNPTVIISGENDEAIIPSIVDEIIVYCFLDVFIFFLHVYIYIVCYAYTILVDIIHIACCLQSDTDMNANERTITTDNNKFDVDVVVNSATGLRLGF